MLVKLTGYKKSPKHVILVYNNYKNISKLQNQLKLSLRRNLRIILTVMLFRPTENLSKTVAGQRVVLLSSVPNI